MRIAPSIELTFEQRTTLEEWARVDRFPARVVERAGIVLLAGAGEQDKEIAHQLHDSQVSRSLAETLPGSGLAWAEERCTPTGTEA